MVCCPPSAIPSVPQHHMTTHIASTAIFFADRIVGVVMIQNTVVVMVR